MTDLTYGAAFADVYDEWYGDENETVGTVQLLTELSMHLSTPRILELGAGTGRLAIPLAAALPAGSVVALDESPEMLQILRSRVANAEAFGGTVIAVEGDMADLTALSAHAAHSTHVSATVGPFDVVFASYNTLLNLHQQGDQARCLAAVAQKLRPHGSFVLDAFVIASDAPQHATTSGVRGDWTLHTTTDFDATSGLVVGSTRSIHCDGREVSRPWRIRYQSPTQLDALCLAAGLQLVSRYGCWKKSAFSDDAARHVSIYQLLR